MGLGDDAQPVSLCNSTLMMPGIHHSQHSHPCPHSVQQCSNALEPPWEAVENGWWDVQLHTHSA